jgi:hypothetical protein
VIDLRAFGVDGVMPTQITAMRDMVKENSPDTFELIHQNIPIVERILTDPNAAANLVKEALASGEAAQAGTTAV